MIYPGIKSLLLIILFCLLARHTAFGQEEYSRDTVDSGEYDEEYYQENDSDNYVYPDYYRIIVSSGYSKFNNMKLSTYSKQFYINVSYAISNFPQPLEYYPTQVGFYNEIGLYNTSLYLNIGPEVRIQKNFYLIPYAGITYIPFTKYQDEQWSLVYYIGAAAGYIININEDVDVIVEGSTDFLKFKTYDNNSYIRIGLSYNLYYPF